MLTTEKNKVESFVQIQIVAGGDSSQLKNLITSESALLQIEIDMNLGVYDVLFTDGLSKRLEMLLPEILCQGVSVSAAGCTSSLRGNKGRIYHGLLDFKLSSGQESEVISCSIIFKPNFLHPHFSSNSIL